MIKSYIMPFILFFLGLSTIVFGKTNPLKISFLNLLILSFIISISTQVINGLLFGAIFIPLIYFGRNHLVPAKKTAHSTTQEKASVYLGLLPGFGLYFLNRIEIENTLKEIHFDQSVLKSTEVALILFLIVLIVLSFRKRGVR